MPRLRLFVAAALALAGCVTQPLPQEELAAASKLRLCQLYSAARVNGFTERAAPILAEIKRRGLTAQEVAEIESQTVRIGQREHVAICAWGPFSDANETVGAGYRSRQFVLGNFGPYVYTDGQVVTAFQR